MQRSFQNFENPKAPDHPTAFTSRRPWINMVIPLLSYSQIWLQQKPYIIAVNSKAVHTVRQYINIPMRVSFLRAECLLYKRGVYSLFS